MAYGAKVPYDTTVATTATTTAMIVANPPQPPFFPGGGGGSGSVGCVLPTALPGSYGLNVSDVLWTFVTLFGILSICPDFSPSSPFNPFASARMYHSVASPHTADAIDCNVSPARTVQLPAAGPGYALSTRMKFSSKSAVHMRKVAGFG